MDEYGEKTQIYMTRSMLLKYLDPFNKMPNLCSRKNSELLNLMFELSVGFYKYKFTDYEYSDDDKDEDEYEDPQIREPDPIVRQRLIEPHDQDFENARYYSQREEAERYRKQIEMKQEEDRLLEEALKISIEEEERRFTEKKKEGPDYERLSQIHSDFTPELCDKLYGLLKEGKYIEFKKEMNNVPTSIVSVIWKLKSPDGDLRSLLISQNNPYKCFE